MVVEACEAALYDVADALLGVTQWQDYWPTLQRVPVPKSAGAPRPEFGALIGEWIPPQPPPFWGLPWPPATLLVLTAWVEVTEGEPAAVAMLRWFCRGIVTTRRPSVRRRGRPVLTARWRATRAVAEAGVPTSQAMSTLERLGWNFQELNTPDRDRWRLAYQGLARQQRRKRKPKRVRRRRAAT
jgi:hypothetical protein